MIKYNCGGRVLQRGCDHRLKTCCSPAYSTTAQISPSKSVGLEQELEDCADGTFAIHVVAKYAECDSDLWKMWPMNLCLVRKLQKDSYRHKGRSVCEACCAGQLEDSNFEIIIVLWVQRLHGQKLEARHNRRHRLWVLVSVQIGPDILGQQGDCNIVNAPDSRLQSHSCIES